MMKKSKLQKENELLKAKLLVKEHEKNYLHIPFSWWFVGRFFAFLGSLGLSIANFFLIVYTWNLLNLGNLEEEYISGFHQLLILYPLVGEYILIGLSAVCLVALAKGGFVKLNSYDKEGLIFGLVGGLIFGLIAGLFVGLIFGLIAGLFVGLIFGLIAGLTVGVIVEFE